MDHSDLTPHPIDSSPWSTIGAAWTIGINSEVSTGSDSASSSAVSAAFDSFGIVGAGGCLLFNAVGILGAIGCLGVFLVVVASGYADLIGLLLDLEPAGLGLALGMLALAAYGAYCSHIKLREQNAERARHFALLEGPGPYTLCRVVDKGIETYRQRTGRVSHRTVEVPWLEVEYLSSDPAMAGAAARLRVQASDELSARCRVGTTGQVKVLATVDERAKKHGWPVAQIVSLDLPPALHANGALEE